MKASMGKWTLETVILHMNDKESIEHSERLLTSRCWEYQLINPRP